MAYIHNPFGVYGDDSANMGMLGQDITDATNANVEPTATWGIDLTSGSVASVSPSSSPTASASSGQDWTQVLSSALGLTGTIVNAATGKSATPASTALKAPTASAASMLPILVIGAVGVVALMFLKKK